MPYNFFFLEKIAKNGERVRNYARGVPGLRINPGSIFLKLKNVFSKPPRYFQSFIFYAIKKLKRAAKQAGKRKEEILTKPLEWDEEALLNIQKHATEQVRLVHINGFT